MIINYENLDHCFVNISDAENDRIKDITSINTETFDAIQYLRDKDGSYVLNEDRTEVLKHTIKIKPPLLITCKYCNRDIFRQYKEDCATCKHREESIRQYNEALIKQCTK